MKGFYRLAPRPYANYDRSIPPSLKTALSCASAITLPLENSAFSALESSMPDSRSVVVYSRKGCHLCEVVKESLSKLSRRGGFTWQEIDVDADSDLRRQYNDEVPVVFIDGRKAFKYRMDEQEFLRKLAS
jgi:glutaredoxin